MIARLGTAYGAIQALAGSGVILLAVVLVGQHPIEAGVRQPLPLVWPLEVLLMIAAQLPLKEILGALERVAERGPQARLIRACITAAIIASTTVVNALTGVDPALGVLVLILAAVAFGSAVMARSDSWVPVLGSGLGWLGLQFTTPLGPQMADGLVAIGPLPAGALAGVAAVAYVLKGPRMR